MKPVTEKIPKSMLEVAGKPFISHQLALIKKNNISKVVICASHLGKYIKDYLDNEPIKDLEIKYSFDGDKLLGTGGAIKKAMSLLDENFFIMYGDSYLDTDFQKVDKYFFSENKSGLMTVFRNNDRYDKSNIEFEDNKIINYNKKDLNENMKFIDYGLGILTAKAFKDFENEMVFDLEQVYRNLLFQNELLGYEVEERFYEIGSFQGLEETNKYLMTNKN